MDTNNKDGNYDETCRVPNEDVMDSSSADYNTAEGMFKAMMENGGTYKVANRRILDQQQPSRDKLGLNTDSCPSQ